MEVTITVVHMYIVDRKKSCLVAVGLHPIKWNIGRSGSGFAHTMSVHGERL